MITIHLLKSKWHYIILVAALIRIIFLYQPQNNPSNKDVESALKRVKTHICRKELVEFAEHTLASQTIYQLQRSCKDDQVKPRNQRVGCISNTTKGLVEIEDSVSNSSLCLDLCFSYSHSFGGYNSQRCYCGDEYASQDSTLEEACQMPERFDWYKVDTGIYKPDSFVSLKANLSTNQTIQIAFLLILNGRSELQVHRLLKNIYSHKHIYYIHVDNRQQYLFERLSILEKKYRNIILSKSRYNTIWGGPTLLRMIIHAFKHLTSYNWNYIINLSESDFPIKPLKSLEKYLALEPSSIYLKPHSIKGYNFIKKQGLDRNFYQCEDRVWRMGKRFLPKGIIYSGGSDWFALPRDFCLSVISDLNRQTILVKPLLKIFNFTLLPAESFFHTLALNSEYCDRVSYSNLRLTNWYRKQGCKCQHQDVVDWCGCSPLVYRSNDWERLRLTVTAEDLFFSRKFDPTISSSVINAVENYLILNDSTSVSSFDTRFWLNVYDVDDTSEKKDELVLGMENFKALSLESLGLAPRVKLTNSTLKSVDFYYESDRFLGLLLRYCLDKGCVQVLVENKNKVNNFHNLSKICFEYAVIATGPPCGSCEWDLAAKKTKLYMLDYR